jgi:hypothetical protein
LPNVAAPLDPARGRAAGAIALAVSIFALLLVASLWSSRHGDPDARAIGPEVAPTPVPSAREQAGAPPAAGGAAERRAQAAPAPRDAPGRFEGRGRIRGELLAQGAELPARWTLALDPSPLLDGAERAEARRIEVEGSTFEAPDLPLGGYRVRAECARANSSEESVLLVRGSSDVFVTLVLRPAGFLDGFVHDAVGGPADGLEVVLEDARDRTRQSTTTDPTGMFVFHDVQDGPYRLLFGDADQPLVPPGELDFRAPSMRWPLLELPATGELLVRARDPAGRAVADAQIEGWGVPRGAARARTGADGTALLRWLLPGRYHLQLSSPDGRRGATRAVVLHNVRVEAEMELR